MPSFRTGKSLCFFPTSYGRFETSKPLTELICWTRMMDPIGQDLETLHELIATKMVGLFFVKDAQFI